MSTSTESGAEVKAKRQAVSDYYAKTLEKTEDLKTNACTTAGRPPEHILKCLENISNEVLSKYYGCGLCIPEGIEGCTVLDLGCGSGRDVYIASQLVGKTGKVIGVDMTQEQIDTAIKAQEYHFKKTGLRNVSFKKGFIEDLGSLGIPPGSVDVIISNCVINLSPDKRAVLKGAFNLLKPGGEMYFSDVYATRRVPKALREDKVLWGECISGALYWNDFMNLAKHAGFLDPRLVEDSEITIDNPVLEKKCAKIRFFSATYRLWKLSDLESHCEDYGQAVIYNGLIPRCEKSYILDGHHEIETGKVFPVCGNTWKMLHDTRLKKYFQFIGNFDTHFGIYEDCGTLVPFASFNGNADAGKKSGGGCC